MRFHTSNIGSISPLPFAENLRRYERQDLTSLWRSTANGIPTQVSAGGIITENILSTDISNLTSQFQSTNLNAFKIKLFTSLAGGFSTYQTFYYTEDFFDSRLPTSQPVSMIIETWQQQLQVLDLMTTGLIIAQTGVLVFCCPQATTTNFEISPFMEAV